MYILIGNWDAIIIVTVDCNIVIRLCVGSVEMRGLVVILSRFS